VGCYLLGLWHFDHFVETFVIGFVVVPLFSAVPLLDYDNAFSSSTSLWGLSLVLYGGLDRLVLICSPLAFVIALCGPLRGPCHLFVPFSTYCNYFYAVLVCFWAYYWGALPFFVLGSKVGRIVTISLFN
jgi:hypothetical protein